MKVLLIGGFLGSGKTTFLLRLLSHMREDLGLRDPVILENEIGEVRVDDQMVAGAGYEVRGLFAGCVCCTLAGELPQAVLQIEQDLNPEWLIIEATGAAWPSSIRENLQRTLGLGCRTVCLVDAPRWRRLYAAMSQLFPFQLEGAELILVNKADLVPEETLQEVIAAVRELEPKAEVLAASVRDGIPAEAIGRLLLETVRPTRKIQGRTGGDIPFRQNTTGFPAFLDTAIIFEEPAIPACSASIPEAGRTSEAGLPEKSGAPEVPAVPDISAVPGEKSPLRVRREGEALTVSLKEKLPAADFPEAQAMLAAQMQAAAGEIVKAGGIIGHIKFILQAGEEAVRLSLTDTEVDITDISRKADASGDGLVKAPSGQSPQASGNVIVFQIPEDRLLRILEKSFFPGL